MKKEGTDDPLLQAELQVEESNAEVVNAINHLKVKVDDGVRSFNKVLQATKKPLTLAAIALLVGIFFGQMARIALSRSTR